jgi:hypothetical protein
MFNLLHFLQEIMKPQPEELEDDEEFFICQYCHESISDYTYSRYGICEKCMALIDEYQTD